MGELLEDGVLRVGVLRVSGTLVSMRIAPAFKGPGASLSGSSGFSLTLGTCSGLSAGIRLAADA